MLSILQWRRLSSAKNRVDFLKATDRFFNRTPTQISIKKFRRKLATYHKEYSNYLQKVNDSLCRLKNVEAAEERIRIKLRQTKVMLLHHIESTYSHERDSIQSVFQLRPANSTQRSLWNSYSQMMSSHTEIGKKFDLVLQQIKVAKLLHKLQNTREKKIPNRVYHRLLEGLINLGDLRQAERNFQTLIAHGRYDLRFYNTLLKGYVINREIPKAILLLIDMFEKHITPNDFTYRWVLSLFLDKGLRRAVEIIADEMSRLGYSFTFLLWKGIYEKKQDSLANNEIVIKMMKNTSTTPPPVPVYLYLLDELLGTLESQPIERTPEVDNATVKN
jgi:pentatricopeptide repeat protein